MAPVALQAFVQALLARGVVRESEARDLYRRATGKPDDSGFDAFWADVNKELAFVSLEMRRAQVPPTHGAPPVRFVAVVNKLADEVAKQANRLGPAEVALFRAVVEAAGTSGRSATHGISSLEALKLELRPAAEDGGAGGGGGGATQAGGGGAGPSQPAAKAAVPKLSPGEREAALASLVADGWLCGGAAGGAGAGYGPGPRAFLELGAFLLSKASDDEAQAAWEACM